MSCSEIFKVLALGASLVETIACRNPPSADPKTSDEYTHSLARLITPFAGAAEARRVAALLTTRFGGVSGTLMAPNKQIALALGDHYLPIREFLIAFRRLQIAALRERAFSRVQLGSYTAVSRYLKVLLAGEVVEHLRVLYLDNGLGLLLEEASGTGTINHAPAYPREIVRRALDLGAKSIILVHNHPSGDPTPSRADIRTTLQLAAAASVFEIDLLDHYIVSRGEVISMRNTGHLPHGQIWVDYSPRNKSIVRVMNGGPVEPKPARRACRPVTQARCDPAA